MLMSVCVSFVMMDKDFSYYFWGVHLRYSSLNIFIVSRKKLSIIGPTNTPISPNTVSPKKMPNIETT